VFKRLSVGVLVAVLLALGVLGAASAQEPTPPTDGVCPYGEVCGGHGMGGYGRGGFGYRGTMPNILADALGMTLEELYVALADGQTIAEVAAAQDVSLDDLVEMLVAPRIEQLKQAVADGYLTQEQADWMIEMMSTQMAWRLENFGLGYGGYGHHGGYGGFGRGGCGMMGGGSYSGQQSGWKGGRWGNNSGTSRSPWQATPSTDL